MKYNDFVKKLEEIQKASNYAFSIKVTEFGFDKDSKISFEITSKHKASSLHFNSLKPYLFGVAGYGNEVIKYSFECSSQHDAMKATGLILNELSKAILDEI